MAIVTNKSQPDTSFSKPNDDELKPVQKAQPAQEKLKEAESSLVNKAVDKAPATGGVMTPKADAVTAQALASAQSMGAQFREAFTAALADEFEDIFTNFIPMMDKKMADAINVVAVDMTSNRLKSADALSIEGRIDDAG